MAKKKRGRPPKDDSEKVKPAFMLNLTDAEHELVKRAVGDGKVSTWARKIIIEAAKRKVKR
ncbi:MAG: hypothetical protein H8E66_24380 [Planctomycetes bacterium]|nr:hypothetical protein [Planctomycetota bacterium]